MMQKEQATELGSRISIWISIKAANSSVNSKTTESVSLGIYTLWFNYRLSKSANSHWASSVRNSLKAYFCVDALVSSKSWDANKLSHVFGFPFSLNMQHFGGNIKVTEL